MSIKKTQLKVKKDEIIHELLKKGIHPNSFEVSNSLNYFTDSNVPGLPYLKPVKAESHGTSDSKHYNKMFKDLNTDLDIIYASNIDQTKRVLMMDEYYSTEQRDVQNELDKTGLRLDNLKDAIDTGYISQNNFQTFNDFYDIEFDGNDDRNIPETNAFVDLNYKKVNINKVEEGCYKYDISKSDIIIAPTSSFVKSGELGDITSILKDTVNEFYVYSISNASNVPVGIVVGLTLDNSINVNCLTMSLATTNLISGILSTSEDGINFTDTYNTSGYTDLQWSFSNTRVKYLKIILLKQEADEIDIATYIYDFIIRNISLYNNLYESTNTYVSKPIVFENIIDNITVKANDMTFPNTSIYYYLGIDNGVDNINWELIENNVEYNLGLSKDVNKIVGWTNYRFGELDMKNQIDNTRLYKLLQLPENTNMNSVRVTPGYQMWYVEEVALEDEDTSLTNFTLAKFKYNPFAITSTSFISDDLYEISINPNTIYTMTQYVYCDSDKYITDKKITQVAQAGGDFSPKSMMIVNGSEIKQTSTSYNIRLTKGRNKIQLLLFVAKPSWDTSVLGTKYKITHNINFKEDSFDVFAFPTMKYTNKYNLCYKVKNNDKKMFAVDEDSNYILVKHNPLMTTTNNFGMGIRYFVSYTTLKKEEIKSLVTSKTGYGVNLRIMATLSNSDTNISPEILDYRIIGR